MRMYVENQNACCTLYLVYFTDTETETETENDIDSDADSNLDSGLIPVFGARVLIPDSGLTP